MCFSPGKVLTNLMLKYRVCLVSLSSVPQVDYLFMVVPLTAALPSVIVETNTETKMYLNSMFFATGLNL